MCGISGLYTFEREVTFADLELVGKMTAVLQHRGPDQRGQFTGRNVVLGHRRLSIIDLHHGKQPSLADDGRYSLTFNGEIYNYKALRAELLALGATFCENSDTEVLLQALIHWDEGALSKINGDFAFAFHDARRNRLLLARDHLGVKPLYFAQHRGAFMFASEIKALLSDPTLDRSLDVHGYFEALAYTQPIPPKTLLKSVSILPPGHLLVVDADGLHERSYWDLDYRGSADDAATAYGHVRSLFSDAVRLRLQADVPLCGLLSGGVDSSVLCSEMARHSADRISTFSIDYRKKDDSRQNFLTHMHESDLPYAKLLADSIDSRHFPIEITEDKFFDSLMLAATARDMPVCLGSETGMYHLFEEVARHAKVALSGDGADEVFLGYYMVIEESLRRGSVDPFFACGTGRIFSMLSPDVIAKYQPVDYICSRFAEVIKRAPGADDPQEALLNQIHYLQIRVILPYLLDRADRISSAHSVELRVPYCDYRLVDYFFNLRADMRYRPGLEKHCLRESFRGLVTDRILDRKKSVFPYPGNPEQLKRLYDASLSLVSNTATDIRRQGLINPESVGGLIRMAGSELIDHLRAHAVCAHLMTLEGLVSRRQILLNL